MSVLVKGIAVFQHDRGNKTKWVKQIELCEIFSARVLAKYIIIFGLATSSKTIFSLQKRLQTC